MKGVAVYIFLMFVSGVCFGQNLKSVGGFLATSTHYDVPENEYWKVMAGFGNEGPAMPADSDSLAAKYSGIVSAEKLQTKKMKGGILMRDMLPAWVAPGSDFNLDPNDLLEIYIEKYKVQNNENEK